MTLVDAVETIRALVHRYERMTEDGPKDYLVLASGVAILKAMQQLGEAVLKKLSEPPTVTTNHPSIFGAPIACRAVDDIAKDELCIVDCAAGTVCAAGPEHEADLAGVIESIQPAPPEDGVTETMSPGAIMDSLNRVADVWETVAPVNTEVESLLGLLRVLVDHVDDISVRRLDKDLLDLMVAVRGEVDNFVDRVAGNETMVRSQQEQEQKQHKAAMAEHANALVDVAELRTKLKLTEANEKELQAQVANFEDAATEYASLMHEARQALKAQRAKEAERVAAVEQAVAALVENYYRKVGYLLMLMARHNDRGLLTRWRRLPLEYAKAVTGWEQTGDGEAGKITVIAESVAATVSTKQPSVSEDDAPAPGSPPAVHPV